MYFFREAICPCIIFSTAETIQWFYFMQWLNSVLLNVSGLNAIHVGWRSVLFVVGCFLNTWFSKSHFCFNFSEVTAVEIQLPDFKVVSKTVANWFYPGKCALWAKAGARLALLYLISKHWTDGCCFLRCNKCRELKGGNVGKKEGDIK